MMNKQQIKRDARHLFRLCRVDGMLEDARVLQVVRGIEKVGHDRFAILDEFLRLINLEEVRRTATIQSATEISQEMHDSIRHDLEQHYGKGLKMTFVEQPRLIAGMRIKVGSDIYDGSVQGRLAAMDSRF